jgi:S-adenosylmethionine decarboxylase
MELKGSFAGIFSPPRNGRKINMVGFVSNNGISYAGKHLLIDLYHCENHGTQEQIESVMIEACKATGATVLFSHLHPFAGDGVSGAVILAESHCTIHTWPEESYIALDIFVCGNCDPYQVLPIFQNWFRPERCVVQTEIRGREPMTSPKLAVDRGYLGEQTACK